jgi:hypothetical protein
VLPCRVQRLAAAGVLKLSCLSLSRPPQILVTQQSPSAPRQPPHDQAQGDALPDAVADTADSVYDGQTCRRPTDDHLRGTAADLAHDRQTLPLKAGGRSDPSSVATEPPAAGTAWGALAVERQAGGGGCLGGPPPPPAARIRSDDEPEPLVPPADAASLAAADRTLRRFVWQRDAFRFADGANLRALGVDTALLHRLSEYEAARISEREATAAPAHAGAAPAAFAGDVHGQLSPIYVSYLCLPLHSQVTRTNSRLLNPRPESGVS